MLREKLYQYFSADTSLFLAGIGELTAKYKSSYIGNSQHINPPSLKLSFRETQREFTVNDLQHWQKITGNTFSNLSNLISDLVQELNDEILERGSANILFLGTLTRVENQLIFIQEIEQNHLKSAFGLDYIQLLPVKNSPLILEKIRFKKTNRVKPVLIAAILVLFVSVFAFNFLNLNGDKVNPQVASVIPEIESTFNEKPIETILQTVDLESKTDINVENSNHKIDNTTSVSENINTNYHVIVGCFKNSQNAITLVNSLIEKGFSSASIVDTNPNGLIRVSISGFQSEMEAEAALEKQYNQVNSSAWVYHKSN